MRSHKIDHLVASTQQIEIKANKLLFSEQTGRQLIETYGSPLYLYCEDIIRQNCRRIKQAFSHRGFHWHYSAKANSNMAILKLLCEEGFGMDAVSPVEMVMGIKAGYAPQDILFVSNNVAVEEFEFAVRNDIRVSINSTGQLQLFGRHFPGREVAVRINPGVGAGHHEHVITGGKKTKFGIDPTQLDEVNEIARRYNLKIVGLNVHIGSNFMEYGAYLQAAEYLLNMAMDFKELSFIDFGGGFGVGYEEGSRQFEIIQMGRELTRLCKEFGGRHDRSIRFIVEPGRYLVAESGLLLITVTDVKNNFGRAYIGTDAGFNVLLRPALYKAYHAIINTDNLSGPTDAFDIVGNICESGDILAESVPMTRTGVGDVLSVMDAGAYGYSMASNYNSRLRPAEVLLQENGKFRLIRRRDRIEDLLENQLIG